ncbi:MAG: rhodanese-like domain-containing protein [Terracidiphilus sp.]
MKKNKGHASPAETNDEQLEISPETALELQRLSLAVLIDIRQKFELEVQGEIPGASFLPLFHFKRMLGHALSSKEQEALDEDVPDLRDIQHFLSMINDMHHSKDLILVCVCNSGHRSLNAARLLRLLGYEHSFSMNGGFHALEEVLEAKRAEAAGRQAKRAS